MNHRWETTSRSFPARFRLSKALCFLSALAASPQQQSREAAPVRLLHCNLTDARLAGARCLRFRFFFPQLLAERFTVISFWSCVVVRNCVMRFRMRIKYNNTAESVDDSNANVQRIIANYDAPQDAYRWRKYGRKTIGGYGMMVARLS